MFEQCKQEVHSDQAIRELHTAEAAIKYYQAVTKRLDRDDKIIQAAIDDAMWMRNFTLVKKLQSLRKDVAIPYEKLIGS